MLPHLFPVRMRIGHRLRWLRCWLTSGEFRTAWCQLRELSVEPAPPVRLRRRGGKRGSGSSALEALAVRHGADFAEQNPILRDAVIAHVLNPVRGEPRLTHRLRTELRRMNNRELIHFFLLDYDQKIVANACKVVRRRIGAKYLLRWAVLAVVSLACFWAILRLLRVA
jgi:hypothetical protein